MRLASRFGRTHHIRRDRPLTRDELAHYVPGVFSEEKHASRSGRYTYIPAIILLDNLQREGFQPFFACQTRVRDLNKCDHTKHMLRLRREGQITRQTGSRNHPPQQPRRLQFIPDAAGPARCRGYLTGWKRSGMPCSRCYSPTGTAGVCQSRADVPLWGRVPAGDGSTDTDATPQ